LKRKPFDRYALYHRAVQSTEVDCAFVTATYKELKGKKPTRMREDFCGGFAICCEWVRRSKDHHAYGIDLDNEPLNYGREHYLPELRPEQRKRVHIQQASVLTAKVAPVDVVIALNFSFYIFKQRWLLKDYFRQALKGLRRNGIFIVDCFGGSDCQQKNVEYTNFPGFTYYWDQEHFDPVTNGGLFHIHFKRKGEKKRERVFTYDWRMWTIPEIREVMLEAGFRRTHVYWEGTTRSGEGDGKFKRVEEGEECEGWVAYVVGEK
jgi:hypothetical protein